MELYSVMESMGRIMMRGGEFDENGNVLTCMEHPSAPLSVSIVFSEEQSKGRW